MGNIDPGVSAYFGSRLQSWQAELRRNSGNKRILHAIEQFNQARSSGKWTNLDHLEIPIHSTPRFISKVVGKINRGETFEVIKVEKGWMQIRRERGLEGWVAVAQAMPHVPVKLNSQPGMGGPDSGSREEIEIGGRG
jgi:hypothetical protein